MSNTEHLYLLYIKYVTGSIEMMIKSPSAIVANSFHSARVLGVSMRHIIISDRHIFDYCSRALFFRGCRVCASDTDFAIIWRRIFATNMNIIFINNKTGSNINIYPSTRSLDLSKSNGNVQSKAVDTFLCTSVTRISNITDSYPVTEVPLQITSVSSV